MFGPFPLSLFAPLFAGGEKCENQSSAVKRFAASDRQPLASILGARAGRVNQVNAV
jgi:hypothetical protein